MDLIILEGLNVTIDLSEIAMMKQELVNNPNHIPAIESKGIKESGGEPYYDYTEITLKCGEKMLLKLPYNQMVTVIKKWMSVNGGYAQDTGSGKDESK